MHLLAGDAAPESATSVAEEAVHEAGGQRTGADAERIRNLEDEVNQLRRELETLRERFATFQRQFQ
jgi:uncharacterized protein YceH (UPF0502 family)